jgi:RND family efflux transporter MFP subunit
MPPRPYRALAAGALALAAAACGAACARPAPPVAHGIAVKVAIVEKAGSAGGTRYSAQIVPLTRVDLSFKVGGYVESVAKAPGIDGKPRILQEGDAVRAGMVLASIRPTDYQQKLTEAEASVAQATASVAQADLDLDRTAKLAASGSVAQAELDGVKTKRDAARAALAGAKARVDEARTAVSDVNLRSPLDGVVLRRTVEVGALAAPGSVGFSVADTSSVKVIFGVPDTVLPRVRLGASQAVTTEAFAGAEFHGRISRIAESADAKSRVFEVEISIPNEDGRLKTGMVAALSLDALAGAQVAPLVPLAAIVRSPDHAGRFAVFVVDDASGKPLARAREVELGEYLGRVIPVKQGLGGGERIVVQGAGLLSDGEAVEVVP